MKMPNFSKRSTQLEIMDDLSHDHATIDLVLDELELINKLLGGFDVTFNALEHLALSKNEKIIISDWGCGGGDTMRRVQRWGKNRNYQFEFVGIDAAQSIVEYAERKCVNFPEISFICSDVFSPEIKDNQFDIVMSTLFTHHFDNEQWKKLIQKMVDSSSKAVIINDLHRHSFAYYAILLLTKLFSRSSMVKNDGPLSVLRAFKKSELKKMLDELGLNNYTIKWMWAFRWQVIIYKSNE